MTDDPTSPLYYKFNFYSIPTDFEYVGVRTHPRPRLVDRQQGLHDAVLQQAELQRRDDDLGDERHRQVEQLPEVRQQPAGDATCRTPASSAPACGRSTRRPIATRSPSDPRTWVDAALPNFHEMFGTTTLQPYAEYSWRALPNLTITPGHQDTPTTSRTSRSSPTTARPSAT